jgi:hypothetical protein
MYRSGYTTVLQWAPENRSQRADPEGWRGWLSAWKEYGVAVDDYHELDEERVLVLVHQHGRGKTSGLEIGQMSAKGASLFRVRDGKVTRLVLWQGGERVLADLGLPLEVSSDRS